MAPIELTGRVAVVTGAGNGLGRAHALELARRGTQVVVNDVGGAVDGSGQSSGPADAVVAEIEASGGEAVADSHSVVDGGEAIIATALAAFGRIDIVVNNAGILRDKAFHNMTSEGFDAVLDVHLRGAMQVSRAAFPYMRAQGFGRIINTTSTAGLLGNFGQANYGSAKAGLYGMTRVLAIEGGRHNIMVNCVAPVASTRMTGMVDNPEYSAMMSPDRVSPVVAYLASAECEVTGEVFSAVGGRVARFFMGLTRGWQSSSLTAEDVRDHLGEIRDQAGYTVPTNAVEEVELVTSRLAARAGTPTPTGPAPLDPTKLRTTWPLGRTVVDQTRVLDYAEATNDPNPLYAQGIAVPPLFGVVASFPGMAASVRAVVPPEAHRIVHGSHDMHFHRTMTAGMALDTTTEAHSYRVRGSNTFFHIRLTSRDDAGNLVLEQFSAFAILGYSNSADAGPEVPSHALPALGELLSLGQYVSHVDHDQTFRYAKASGDESPIHLDPDIARSAGLPGIIVHGLCTMAMCGRAVTETVAQGDPRRLSRLAVRFAGNVLPGADVVTTIYQLGANEAGGRSFGFQATSGKDVVIKDGRADISPTSREG
jgi:NAD(P)-dependent dehydrogenase (short-subunit alcohol dehydrogenase family)/acyl dehydratase